MTIFKILRLSAGTIFRKRGMILGLWLFTTAFSLMLAVPPYILLNHEFGRSLTESSVGRVNFLWTADIHHRFRDLLPSLPLWLAAPALLFLIFWIFLSGGMLGNLSGDEKSTFRSFCADSGKYFPKFLGVFLISLSVLVIVFGGLYRLVQIPLNGWAARVPDETALFAVSLLRLIILGFLYSFVRLFFDYVKVRIVLAGECSPIRAIEDTLLGLSRYFIKAWILFLMAGILFALLSGFFLTVLRFLPSSGTGALTGAFIFSQLYVAARIAFQAFVYATEIHFARSFLKP